MIYDRFVDELTEQLISYRLPVFVFSLLLTIIAAIASIPLSAAW